MRKETSVCELSCYPFGDKASLPSAVCHDGVWHVLGDCLHAICKPGRCTCSPSEHDVEFIQIQCNSPTYELQLDSFPQGLPDNTNWFEMTGPSSGNQKIPRLDFSVFDHLTFLKNLVLDNLPFVTLEPDILVKHPALSGLDTFQATMVNMPKMLNFSTLTMPDMINIDLTSLTEPVDLNYFNGLNWYDTESARIRFIGPFSVELIPFRGPSAVRFDRVRLDSWTSAQMATLLTSWPLIDKYRALSERFSDRHLAHTTVPNRNTLTVLVVRGDFVSMDVFIGPYSINWWYDILQYGESRPITSHVPPQLHCVITKETFQAKRFSCNCTYPEFQDVPHCPRVPDLACPGSSKFVDATSICDGDFDCASKTDELFCDAKLEMTKDDQANLKSQENGHLLLECISVLTASIQNGRFVLKPQASTACLETIGVVRQWTSLEGVMGTSVVRMMTLNSSVVFRLYHRVKPAETTDVLLQYRVTSGSFMNITASKQQSTVGWSLQDFDNFWDSFVEQSSVAPALTTTVLSSANHESSSSKYIFVLIGVFVGLTAIMLIVAIIFLRQRRTTAKVTAEISQLEMERHNIDTQLSRANLLLQDLHGESNSFTIEKLDDIFHRIGFIGL